MTGLENLKLLERCKVIIVAIQSESENQYVYIIELYNFFNRIVKIILIMEKKSIYPVYIAIKSFTVPSLFSAI